MRVWVGFYRAWIGRVAVEKSSVIVRAHLEVHLSSSYFLYPSFFPRFCVDLHDSLV